GGGKGGGGGGGGGGARGGEGDKGIDIGRGASRVVMGRRGEVKGKNTCNPNKKRILWIEIKLHDRLGCSSTEMAVWVETYEGKLVETIFAPKSIGKVVFKHDLMPGAINRPSALLYWGHNRGKKTVPETFCPMPNIPNPMP
ncbi:MAG: hypothetical protein PHQ65_13915, partial [Bacteroidales bacterium]|nr:hypothetical protein [Bacteroidales bacterium]